MGLCQCRQNTTTHGDVTEEHVGVGQAGKTAREVIQDNQRLSVIRNVNNKTDWKPKHSERENLKARKELVSNKCEEPLFRTGIFTRKKRNNKKLNFNWETKRKINCMVHKPFVVKRHFEKDMDVSYIRVNGAKTRDIQVYPPPLSSTVTALVMDTVSEIAKSYPCFNFIYTTTGILRLDIGVIIVFDSNTTLFQDVEKSMLLPDNIDLRCVRNCCLIILHSFAGDVKTIVSDDHVWSHMKVVDFIYDENVGCKINEDTLNFLNELIEEDFMKETVFVYSKNLTNEINNISTYLSGLVDLSLEHQLEVVQVLTGNQKIIVPCVDLFRDFENLQAALSGIPTPYHRNICIVYIHHTEPHVLDRKKFRSKEIIKDIFTVGEIVDCVYKGNFVLYDCSLNKLASKKVSSFLTDSKEKRMPSVSSLHEALPAIKPWRTVNTNNLPEEKFFQLLKDDIKQLKPLQSINILNIGYIGAGKSSFVNTITSTLKSFVARVALSGMNPKSTTTMLDYYGFDEFPHIRLWDTRGIDSEYGLGSTDFECLLNGNIKQGYAFDKTKPITEENMMYNSNPSLADKPHVVCFVFDGNILQGLLKQDSHATDLKEFIEHFEKSRGLRYVILLTKMDEVCSIVATDSSKVYTSETVHQLVKDMAAYLNMPPSRIVPIVNYNSNDTEKNISTDIVALIALRQLLRHADDFITNALQGR